jgi:hypothetical protein
MSGGSANYLYEKLEAGIDNFYYNTPIRKAFRAHLLLVIDALHDMEWVDSCDYSDGMDTEAIMKCITQSDVLEAAIADAKEAMSELKALIDVAERGRE